MTGPSVKEFKLTVMLVLKQMCWVKICPHQHLGPAEFTKEASGDGASYNPVRLIDVFKERGKQKTDCKLVKHLFISKCSN